jgi:CDC6, C terminal winged helix domain
VGNGVLSSAPLPEVFDAYVCVCKSLTMKAATRDEFRVMCELLAEMALLTLSKPGGGRGTKIPRVSMRVSVRDLQLAISQISVFDNLLSGLQQ